MTIFTNPIPGHEYLAFLSNPAYWPQSAEASVYAEEVVLQVDGHAYEQLELSPDTISEHSEVVILGGQVFEGMEPLHTLRAHFDSWREANAETPRRSDTGRFVGPMASFRSSVLNAAARGHVPSALSAVALDLFAARPKSIREAHLAHEGHFVVTVVICSTMVYLLI